MEGVQAVQWTSVCGVVLYGTYCMYALIGELQGPPAP